MNTDKKLSILRDILGDFTKSGQEYLFSCPNPGCNHQKKKMSINLDKNKFKCWICEFSGSSIFKLVRRFGSFRHKEEWPRTQDEFRRINELPSTLKKLFEDEESQEKTFELPEEFQSLSFRTAESEEAREYFSRRGGEFEDLYRWKPGFCASGDFSGRILFPSFNMDGKINYWVGRAINKREWPPYKNLQSTRNIIFNELLIDWDLPVVLTEGIFDSIIAGKNSIPILGSTLQENSKLFQKIVHEDAVVYLALDPDAEKKSFKLIKQFLEYNIELFNVNIEGFKDVGEMTKEEFQKRKAQASMITQENFLDNKINSILRR